MGNKQHYDLKVAILCEVERHRAEMTSINEEAQAAGYTNDEVLAASLEVLTELGGAAIVAATTPRRLSS